LEFVLKNCH